MCFIILLLFCFALCITTQFYHSITKSQLVYFLDVAGDVLLDTNSYTLTFCFVFCAHLQHFITKINRKTSLQTNAISNSTQTHLSVKLHGTHISLCHFRKIYFYLAVPAFHVFVLYTFHPIGKFMNFS